MVEKTHVHVYVLKGEQVKIHAMMTPSVMLNMDALRTCMLLPTVPLPLLLLFMLVGMRYSRCRVWTLLVGAILDLMILRFE